MGRSAILNVMEAAVLKAAKGLNRDFGEVANLQISRKGASDFVTATDTRAEKLLFDELKKARPAYGFLMEEQGEVAGDGVHRWVIDPLDGTHNFIHAIPYFCISVALEKIVAGKREIHAALVYDPIHNEMFMAEKGQGAYVNDRRLQVSRRDAAENMMLATGAPRPGKPEFEQMGELMRAASGFGSTMRLCGAAALDLAYVAAGRFDAFWHSHLRPWDLAAGILLVREAGGIVTDLAGADGMLNSGTIIAGNPLVQPKLLSLLKPVYTRAA